jgi:hypothetical protein
VAIVQISQITNRKGRSENLPQLAGAELGWSIDSRQLWIGNGTIQEGAPVIGNTEILTEFSDIFELLSTYTYRGDAAGYTVQTGPTANPPITQSLQSWLDQFATVKDFGAIGDGVADDTDAINRALYQLYCRDNNTQIRRSLFFPAGTYRVTGTIYIPAYAMLYGEGADSSVIQLDNLDDSTNKPTAQTVESLVLNVDGVSYDAVSGATQNITVTNLGFRNLNQEQNVFLFQDASACSFKNVGFYGPLTTTDITNTQSTYNSAAVAFINSSGQTCNNITIDTSEFSGTVWGMTSDDDINGITISSSTFDTLFQGVTLGTGTVVNGGPSGVRIISNSFDNVYAEGIVFDNVSLNASGQNIFYDVGNYFNGVANPETAIINIVNNDNLSISDLFERSDANATVYPRIDLNGSRSIGIVNGKQLEMGTLTVESGLTSILVNNTGSPTTIVSRDRPAFRFDYTITRGAVNRTGTIVVTNSASPSYTDDFTQTAETGITLTATESGGVISIKYTATNTGVNGNIYYSISYLPTFI